MFFQTACVLKCVLQFCAGVACGVLDYLTVIAYDTLYHTVHTSNIYQVLLLMLIETGCNQRGCTQRSCC